MATITTSRPGFKTDLVLVAFLAVVAAGAADARGACPERIGRDIPTTKSPERYVSLSELAALNDEIDRSGHDVRALLLVRRCTVVFERYKQGISRDHRLAAYSITKSIVSTVAGVAIKQGRMPSLEVKVADLLDRPSGLDVEAWERTSRIRLADFMGMRSGLEYKHDPRSHPIYNTAVDRLAVALSAKVVAAPGERFNYSDGDASVTGALIAAAFKTTIRDAAQDNLWQRLGGQPIEWFGADRVGRFPGGWATHVRPMDLAKFGLLHLNGGVWNGEALIDVSYARAVWTAGPNPRYGLGWWIGDAKRYGVKWYMANGFKGQRIYVMPELDLVVVVMASLTEKESSATHPLIIQRSIAAARGASSTSAEQAAERLRTLVHDGFRGRPTIEQRDQDTPRR